MFRAPDPPRSFSHPPISERAARVVIVLPGSLHREQLQALLEREGNDCVCLPDGDELLRVCAEFEPDLLLLGVDLPHASGLELCGEVRASDPGRHVPVLLLGSGVGERAVAAGLMAGADDFIADMTCMEELRARVHVQLRNKRMLDALQRVRSERDVLRRDAHIDPLTGLQNRRSLEAQVTERCRKRERFGVLFIDIDHFKSVNDRFGHDVGDRVLINVSNVLRAALRPGDVVARYGGEEFVALIASAGPESARLVAERLRRHVEEMPPLARGPSHLTLSVGATVFDPQRVEEAPTDILRRADVALYAAKGQGRNRVCLHLPGVPPESGAAGAVSEGSQQNTALRSG